MTKSEHTPGPWTVGEQNGHGGISVGATDLEIATVYLGLVTSQARWGEEHLALPENQEAVANARVVAASPDFYRAAMLRREYEALPTDRGGANGPKAQARKAWLDAEAAAVAKADGDTS